MGSAILEGLIDQGTLSARHAIAYDPAAERSAAAQRMGVEVAASARELAKKADILVLAVKPQAMESALAELDGALKPDVLVVSIAAGISIAYLQARLGATVRVVRVMPNTPALVHSGAAGIALAPNCTEADALVARTIFEAIGIAEIVPESAIDAVTALSGSGPAYFFYMVECMVNAAVSEGLDESTATRLAAQTLFGAGRLLQATGEAAAALRQKVTSKGGTTEAALNRFRAGGFEELVSAAVKAAAARSRELGA
jgi:pyrroline-5-carboxylate reductase